MKHKRNWAGFLSLCLAGCVVVTFGCSGAGCRETAPESPVVLAHEGLTDFRIVLPSESTEVDQYAAEQLALYLGLSTGAEFPIVEAGNFDPGDGPGIFLGTSAQVEKVLAGDPVRALESREHVSRTKDGNLFLYGQGIHGNLYAVIDFLRHAIDWRWFSTFEAPVFAKHETLAIDPIERRSTPSFDALRTDIQRNLDFPYLQGANLNFSATIARFAQRGADVAGLGHFVSAEPEVGELYGKSGHTLFAFIPPDAANRYANVFSWLEQKDYFATHPDFFSMNASGTRIPNMQLNFGNPELRSELTKNVLKLIEQEGDDTVIPLGAMDVPGRFCHSPESIALEEKYQSLCGPIIDYLLELCAVLQEKHPKVRVKTFAYRRAQTQEPPVLPGGRKLPDNLIVEFAPVEDNYFGDWTSKDPLIQETIAHFKGWSEITAPGNLWAWIYPNPWGSGYGMPVGNTGRTVRNMRALHELGARGIVNDLIGLHQRSGFGELHAFLILRLAMDIDADVDTLIVEFTDAMYGSAAPAMRTYLEELNQEREQLDPLPPGVTIASRDLDEETFPYLTPENIHRWQSTFEAMENELSPTEVMARTNVRLARRELDFATLWRWFDLQDAFPDVYTDHKPVAGRIRAANDSSPQPLPDWYPYDVNREWKTHQVRTGLLEDLEIAILAGREVKPLPDELRDVPPERIRAFLPNRRGGADEDSYFELDADAATGLALVVDEATLPHKIEATRDGPGRLSLVLDREDIMPGQYQIHELGELVLDEKSRIALSPSWRSTLEVGQRLHEPGAENRWQVYVSMKFDGPLYGGGGTENRLLVDRIYLVRLGLDQFDSEHLRRE